MAEPPVAGPGPLVLLGSTTDGKVREALVVTDLQESWGQFESITYLLLSMTSWHVYACENLKGAFFAAVNLMIEFGGS